MSEGTKWPARVGLSKLASKYYGQELDRSDIHLNIPTTLNITAQYFCLVQYPLRDTYPVKGHSPISSTSQLWYKVRATMVLITHEYCVAYLHILVYFCIRQPRPSVQNWQYCDFQNFVYFRPIRDSRIQHLQKNIPVTLSHIMATNTALRGRQHAESAESNCVHKQTEEKRINNHNSPPRQCKNTLPPAGFGTFLLVAPHTAMLW